MSTPAPHETLFQIMQGMWVSQIASAFTQLGIPDLIAAGKQDLDALAKESGANAQALHRLMRGAQTIGLCVESAPKQFELTPVGATLRANVPGSMRDLVLAETAPGHWLPWGRLADSVRTGKPMTTETLGTDAWTYYAKNPEEGQCFARGMGNISAIAAEHVAAVYDPSSATRIVDVGGSEGVMLRGLLRRAPNARGVLFDRADIIEYAKTAVAAKEFSDRIELVGGDFFKEVPAGGDLYILKHILHDWSDEECEAIVKNVHRASAPNGKLLIIEMLLPDQPQPSPASLMDLNMMVMVGGRERTEGEFRELLERCGYTLARVLPTAGTFNVLEAVRT